VSSKYNRLEQLISFSGICGIVGTVCDLLTPVGNYTLWCLAAGAAAVFVGLVLLRVRGFSEATNAALSFGLILSVVSIGFLVAAPDPAQGQSTGVIATKIDWVADAQEEILGLTKQVEQIAADTADIKSSAVQIARNTEAVFSLNLSDESFSMAMESQDAANIALHCERGYRADHFSHLLARKHETKYASKRNFVQLQELQCFDLARLCDTDYWGSGSNLDEDRVGALCGPAGTAALGELKTAKLQQDKEAEAMRKTKYKECLESGGDEHFLRSHCAVLYKRRSTF
jgi:hypothetical protein